MGHGPSPMGPGRDQDIGVIHPDLGWQNLSVKRFWMNWLETSTLYGFCCL
jgi:hypothetical protein